MSSHSVDRQAEIWDEEFEGILLRHLSVPGAHRLSPADELAKLGLDSLRTVQLLLELEEHYAIAIPDEWLRAETFATGASLWRVVERTRRGDPGTP